MKNIRNLIAYFLAFALAAFAVPGLADDKKFDLAASPSVGVNQSIEIVFTNRDDGNSTFNSVQVAGIPGSGSSLEIVSASQTGSAKPGKPTISADKKSLTYTELSPIKPNYPLRVTLVVKTSTPTCASGIIQWTGSAWTGSPSTPSNPFTTTDSPVTVLSSGTCTAQFVTQPKNAVIAQRITSTAYKPADPEVQVKLLAGTQPVANAWVDLTSSCSTSGALSLTGASIQTGADGIAKFVALESSTAGASCKLTATLRDVTSATDTSSSFDVVNAAATFSPVPTSVSVEKESTVTVKLVVVGSNPEQVIGQSGSGTITVTGGTCKLISSETTTTNGVLNFLVQGKDVGTTCAFEVNGEFGGVAFGSGFKLTVSGVMVYTGVLACDDAPFDALAIPAYNPLDPTTFNASPGTANGTEDTAFLVGARSKGDTAKDDCTKNINFTVTNFIPVGSGSGTDPLNNVVPEGGWSFTWDPTVPNPVIGVITTYQSKWADDDGVLDSFTYICTPTVCPGSPADYPAAWKKLPFCVATVVTHSSIPVGEAACLARVVETTIVEGDQAYCAGTPPPPPVGAPSGWKRRCIQATEYSIIGKDPVFIR